MGTTAIDFIDQYTPLNIYRQEKETDIHVFSVSSQRNGNNDTEKKFLYIQSAKVGLPAALHYFLIINHSQSESHSCTSFLSSASCGPPADCRLRTIGYTVSVGEASAARIIYSPPKKIAFYNVT